MSIHQNDLPTTADADLLEVVHDEAEWLGHMLTRLDERGEEPVEGADDLYRHLIILINRWAKMGFHSMYGRRGGGGL